MDSSSLNELIQKDTGLIVSPAMSREELRQVLAAYLNELINHDFEKLISLLYRIDVDEQKMRLLLVQQQNENAAVLIADLIIERQLQKTESRKQSAHSKDIPDEDKW